MTRRLKVGENKRLKRIIENNFQYRILSVVTAIFFSVLWVFSAQLDLNDEIRWGKMTIVWVVIVAVILSMVVSFILTKLDKIKLSGSEIVLPRKTWWLCFAIILFFNVLVMLALFPGVYGYDSVLQTRQFLDGFSVGTHYSVLFSAILYFFSKGGWWLFAIFVFLQILFLTFVETKISFFVVRWIKSWWILIIVVGFFISNTFIKILISSSCQDTLFGGVFALIMMFLIEMAENPKDFLCKKRNYILLPILLFLLMLLRNNGVYAVVVMALIGFIVLRKYWEKLCLLLLLPIVIFGFYNGPFLDILGVNKDNDALKEMMSIPSQQLTRAFYAHPERFSEDDWVKLKNFYADVDGMIAGYKKDPAIADNRKKRLKQDYVENHKEEFVKFYLEIGGKSFNDYIEGAMLTNMGYYYPFKRFNDERMYHPFIETTATNKIGEHINKFKGLGMPELSVLPNYKKFLVMYAGDITNRDKPLIWQKMIGIRLFLNLELIL